MFSFQTIEFLDTMKQRKKAEARSLEEILELAKFISKERGDE